MKLKQIKTDQARDSGMALTLIFLIIIYYFDEESLALPAMAILLVTMTKPIVIKPFAFLWFNLSHMIGSVVSRIILSIVYFIIVLPVGIILRLTGKDPMNLKKWKNGKENSAMIERNHTYSPKDLTNPF